MATATHKCEVSQGPAGGAACSAISQRSRCAASCVVTSCTCAFCNNVLATRTSQPPRPHCRHHVHLSLPGTLQHTRHITLSFGDEFPPPQPLHSRHTRSDPFTPLLPHPNLELVSVYLHTRRPFSQVTFTASRWIHHSESRGAQRRQQHVWRVYSHISAYRSLVHS